VARVSPFRAIRYAGQVGADITGLTAPPYDVISPERRESLLAGDAHNVVALELAEGGLDPRIPGNRYDTAGKRWRAWLADGTLVRDPEAVFYVLEQRYTIGDAETVRRALIAAVGLEPFSAGIVLPHERTLPKAIQDRLEITRATAANLSQVFGIYSDPDNATNGIIESGVSGTPLASATDEDGVVSSLWALRDPEGHRELAALFADRQIFIADGHHRYTTALAYRDERREAQRDATSASPAYDSVMMALVNMDDPGLVVRPTHRIADAPGDFDADAFRTALATRFELADLPPGHPSNLLSASAGRPSFIVRTRDGITKIARLREDIDHDEAFPATASAAWRALDVSVLQELVLSPLLDIHPDRPETLERLSFSKDAHAALQAIDEGHDAVFILNPTPMEQVAQVALAGETMPQKSTYFYPKLLSGLVFKSLED
jgi:uncharacterized protein (DUF1015 family)